VGRKGGGLRCEGRDEELTLLTAMTRLVACAAFAAVCEDIVSFN
jgi:hypothetical protein